MSAGLQAPPPDLRGFPMQPARQQSRTLYRIFHARHHTTGTLNPPWHYSSAPAPAAGSRFDLPAPHGTCYWSDRRYGAWVEVFRGARLVDPVDARARRLFTAEAPTLRLADVTAARAYSFGVTAELSTMADYRLPQQWAKALHSHGAQAVRGTCRHDPTSRAHNIAVFGGAGPATRRRGWRTSRGAVETDLVLLSELAELGVRMPPVPHSVPITTP